MGLVWRLHHWGTGLRPAGMRGAEPNRVLLSNYLKKVVETDLEVFGGPCGLSQEPPKPHTKKKGTVCPLFKR